MPKDGETSLTIPLDRMPFTLKALVERGEDKKIGRFTRRIVHPLNQQRSRRKVTYWVNKGRKTAALVLEAPACFCSPTKGFLVTREYIPKLGWRKVSTPLQVMENGLVTGLLGAPPRIAPNQAEGGRFAPSSVTTGLTALSTRPYLLEIKDKDGIVYKCRIAMPVGPERVQVRYIASSDRQEGGRVYVLHADITCHARPQKARVYPESAEVRLFTFRLGKHGELKRVNWPHAFALERALGDPTLRNNAEGTADPIITLRRLW